ncbi:RICIN domain-containing protein [Krasilnikovia sp. MM14-A1259]|uniref:RICIN domain-containing protein n=1 Tax=Krasilnikovia sp. MM14-A1259 TaxID=3373539 RepID=UPI003819D6F3
MHTATTRLTARALLTAASTTAAVMLLTGAAIAAPAVPATGLRQATQAAHAAASADDELPTSEEDKVKAAREIGVEARSDWLNQTDRNFVFKIWQNSAAYPVIRDAAELALAADDDTIEAACRAFILKGIFDAKKADDAKKISDETAARQARDLKRAAYAAAGITVDADGRMLVLSERDTVIEIFKKAAGARVKASAEAAIKGDSGLQHTFLTTGVKTAAEQDVQDAIKAAADADAAEKARIAREGAMRAAAAVLGVVADPGKLAMSDDNFIRWIWETVDAQNRPEVRAAAERALRNSDPAAWRAFIDTGIHTANKADLDRELAKKEAADRRVAEEIKNKAAADGADNLLTATIQALAAGGSDLDDFVRVGQYQIPDDDANRPSAGTWEWRNVNSNKCLSIRDGDMRDGTELIQWDCSPVEEQQWIAMRVYNTGGEYRLISARDRTKCVSLANGSGGNGTAFVIRTCDGKPDQNFYYGKTGDNYIWINERIQRAVTVKEASWDNGMPAIAWDVNEGTNQQWYPTNTRLTAGQRLEEARMLHSHTGDVLIVQTDGNLVIYKDGHAVWATNTNNGVKLINHRDGNLVFYRADNTPVWSSNTAGNGPSTLQLQDDGNLVLYRNSDGKATWDTHTWRAP